AHPLDSVANVRRINAVWLRRQPVDRAALRARWEAQGRDKRMMEAASSAATRFPRSRRTGGGAAACPATEPRRRALSVGATPLMECSHATPPAPHADRLRGPDLRDIDRRRRAEHRQERPGPPELRPPLAKSIGAAPHPLRPPAPANPTRPPRGTHPPPRPP